MRISDFIDNNFKHFNAAALRDAAIGYKKHVDEGGKVLVAMAGAMSTAELGISLAEMIRQDKVHAISCTGANLEEDIFNLVAHDFYERVPNYRDFSPQDEKALLDRHMNRVTDTCIPEEEAIRRIEHVVLEKWIQATKEGKSYFPHEYLYQILPEGTLEKYYQIDPKNSWMLAACEKNLPIFVPGWEDSTLGNIITARIYEGKVSPSVVRTGVQYMLEVIKWYKETSKNNKMGFFQIAGGIAGDFPVCVVPLIQQDLEDESIPKWSYYCQTTDSTTSYGSYSGCIPNEKITWGKLDVTSESHIIESDATIVAPLVFAYVLGQ